MKKILAVILCVLGLNACATLQPVNSHRHDQEKRLAVAIKLQNRGLTTAAMEALISLCAERGEPGITDEALFRLSLLYLVNGSESDKESLELAQQGFQRLRKEYPSSSWTRMATPVSDLLTTMADLRKQNQGCKTQNQSLSKENLSLSKENQSLSRETQELRQNIEKLKRLDLELEQKR
ncbi:MAG TPA: hypothetical protein VMJ66_00830 [Geobacteraceae bacterium]|nr:hypothetical protein [Geobacteraceae bacterium]